MKYPDEERICYICYVADNKEIIRCSLCSVPAHKECLQLFRLAKSNTQKKAKYADSIYNKIKPFPQLQNPAFKSWMDPWICEKCIANIDDKQACHFC
mmetsp:Transcript_13251/g.11340  ORF Transcript_13251/g.11340 Transcript_13251/m.11340 type:complete len:97 (-) Transcript_13251:4119-4409(-)